MERERQQELLSAYLDRELSPDERAAVDRTLENAPEARHCLDELASTSRFLRRLSAQPLEADFASSVIDRLRREELLRPEPQAPKRPNRRTVWWTSGALAAAAVLVVAVSLNRGPQPRSDTPSSPIAAAPVRAVASDQSAQATAPERADDELLEPGDLWACNMFVVDVVSAAERVRAFCVQDGIMFDADVEDVPADQSTSHKVAWIKIDTDHEKARKLFGQIVAEASAQSRQPSPFLGVTFDRSKMLTVLSDAEKRINLDEEMEPPLAAPSREPAVSEARVSETATKAGNTPDTVVATTRRAGTVESADVRREMEAKDLVGRVAAEARSQVAPPLPADSAAPAATLTTKRAPGMAAADAAQPGTELQQLDKLRFKQAGAASNARLSFTPSAQQVRSLLQEYRIGRTQAAVAPQPHEPVRVLMQLQQIPDSDEPSRKKRN